MSNPISLDHYKQHPSGVECIEITEHFNFNLGNAIKYIWRAGRKDDPVQDLQKAAFYVEREIQKLTYMSRSKAPLEECKSCTPAGLCHLCFARAQALVTSWNCENP